MYKDKKLGLLIVPKLVVDVWCTYITLSDVPWTLTWHLAVERLTVLDFDCYMTTSGVNIN